MQNDKSTILREKKISMKGITENNNNIGNKKMVKRKNIISSGVKCV